MNHTILKPVVLIPGFAGSKLVEKCPPKLAKSCPNFQSNDFVNLNLFDTEWQDKFSLRYDKHRGLLSEDAIEVHDFGGIDGVRKLCNNCDTIDGIFNYFFKMEVINKVYNYRYYDTLIDRMMRDGYVPSINLYGAPYDFRKIMINDYLQNYFTQLKDLIEKSYETTKQRSTVVAHSIGCLITYIFLVEYSESSWKSKYIDKFVSVAGPYGGSSIALKTLLSGIPRLTLLKEKYHSVIQHSSGLVLALPNVLGYDTDDLIVYDAQKSRCFFKHNYTELLQEVPYRIWKDDVQQYIPTFVKNTGIKTIFVNSTDSDTEMSYYYESTDFNNHFKDPHIMRNVAGDSVIPAKSLLFHENQRNWYQNYSFVHVPKSEHTEILYCKELYDVVLSD